MARARNIKPGFFKNEILAELPCEVRLLFIGLWTLADREGRLEDRPKRIKAELFAFESFNVEPMLDRLRADGFLVRYEEGGKSYIHITNFVKHQDPHYKEKASEIPPPPGFENEVKATNVTRTQRARILARDGETCKQCGSTDHLSIDHIVPVSRGGDSSDDNLQVLCLRCNTGKSNKLDGEDRARKTPKQGVLPGSIYDPIQVQSNVEPTLNGSRAEVSASVPLIPDSGFLIPDSGLRIPAAAAPTFIHSARKTRVPAGFCISERVMAWAEEKGFQRLNEHLEAFVSKAKAKGYTYADWDAAFMEAIREDWAKLRGRTKDGSPAAGESKTTPTNPADIYKPAPALTREQLEANRVNAAKALDAIKRKGLKGLKETA